MRWATLAWIAMLALPTTVAAQADAPSSDVVNPDAAAPSATTDSQAQPVRSEPDDAVAAGSQAPQDAQATPAAEAPTSDELEPNMDLSLAELEALDLDHDSEGVDTSLILSGFMDATFISPFGVNTASTEATIGREPTFMVGSLNVYLQKQITASVRTMAEVRFLYLPNGYQLGVGDVTATDTNRTDYASVSEYSKWGSIEIERAYLDWMPHALFSIRIGEYLTPYGIWNVDHGSPVVLTTQRPYAVSGVFIPERQTGLQLFGRWDATSAMTFGYHLTLSNGQGSLAEYRDLDANKAFGGRLFAQYRGLGELAVGVSGYYGRETFGDPEIGFNEAGIGLNYTYSRQADNAAIAGDLLWKWEGLHVQGEWVGRQLRYTDEGRAVSPIAGQLGIPRSGSYADSFDWSGYGLIGYRLPWLGIMPFATFEHMSRDYYGLDLFVTWTQVGVNIRPISEVVIKAEIMNTWNAASVVGKPRMLQAQVAWVF